MLEMGRMKIMVVDDNTVNLATLEQELSDKYDVIPMLTGRRAIKYLYRETCDLILLDVQMPIMDGIETLREIRMQENGVNVPVIFLTARRDAQTVLEGSKLGIIDFITKPFDTDNLKERIDAAFKKLGIIPLENQELIDRMEKVYKFLLNLDIEKAGKEVNELLMYKMDADILGRIGAVKDKIDTNNCDGAIEMVEHILELLDRMLDDIDRDSLVPISKDDIKLRLVEIVVDLDGFKTSDAITKLKELKKYDIPDKIRRNLKTALDYLKGYDDVEAKKLIQLMIKEVEKDIVDSNNSNKNSSFYGSRLNAK